MIGFRTIMTGGMKSRRTVLFSYPKFRLAVSFLIAAGAYSLFLLSKHLAPGPSDFSVVWHGARLLFDGKNPYDLIGPGREIPFGWNLHYPASTLVAAAPLAVLPESIADFAFVFGSAFLLAYGALKENLNRIWIFLSAAFVVNAKSGQWSALTAFDLFPSTRRGLCCPKADGRIGGARLPRQAIVDHWRCFRGRADRGVARDTAGMATRMVPQCHRYLGIREPGTALGWLASAARAPAMEVE